MSNSKIRIHQKFVFNYSYKMSYLTVLCLMGIGKDWFSWVRFDLLQPLYPLLGTLGLAVLT